MSCPAVVGERAVLAPARSCGRRRGAGCEPGTAPGPMPSRSATPGPEPLEQRVGLLDEPQHDLRSVRVPSGRRPPTGGPGRGCRSGPPSGSPSDGRSIDPDHVGAEVGEDHGAERARADPGHLDHAHTRERTHRRRARALSGPRPGDGRRVGCGRATESTARTRAGPNSRLAQAMWPSSMRWTTAPGMAARHLELLRRAMARSRSVTSTVVGTSISPIQRRAL